MLGLEGGARKNVGPGKTQTQEVVLGVCPPGRFWPVHVGGGAAGSGAVAEVGTVP